LSSIIKIKGIEFYPGVSYRNIMIWRNYPYEKMPDTTPPHDITGREYAPYFPVGDGANILNEIMNESRKVIIGSTAIAAAKNSLAGDPVSAWLWGGGRKPAIEPITTRFGLTGSTISAVDLIHGIGRAAGLTPCEVEGATGYLDTNYTGKAQAALERLRMGDTIVVVHIESPDESGHEGNVEHKVRAIEDFDRLVVGPIIEGVSEFNDVTILCMPDHPTLIATKTHSSDPVPFAIYRKKGFSTGTRTVPVNSYSEKEAARTGLFVEDASILLESLINGRIE
ncbi:MAG TPA: phosphoglycerate mutase, partial [Spirochaetota bacterium]